MRRCLLLLRPSTFTLLSTTRTPAVAVRPVPLLVDPVASMPASPAPVVRPASPLRRCLLEDLPAKDLASSPSLAVACPLLRETSLPAVQPPAAPVVVLLRLALAPSAAASRLPRSTTSMRAAAPCLAMLRSGRSTPTDLTRAICVRATARDLAVLAVPQRATMAVVLPADATTLLLIVAPLSRLGHPTDDLRTCRKGTPRTLLRLDTVTARNGRGESARRAACLLTTPATRRPGLESVAGLPPWILVTRAAWPACPLVVDLPMDASLDGDLPPKGILPMGTSAADRAATRLRTTRAETSAVSRSTTKSLVSTTPTACPVVTRRCPATSATRTSVRRALPLARARRDRAARCRTMLVPRSRQPHASLSLSLRVRRRTELTRRAPPPRLRPRSVLALSRASSRRLCLAPTGLLMRTMTRVLTR